MKIRKLLGGLAWFMLAAVLILFNASAVDAQVLDPMETQEMVYRISCEQQ